MRKLKFFAILDGIVMIISVIVMYIITYTDKFDDNIYTELSSRLEWITIFGIIFLISTAFLFLALSIIIIHKIIQDMRKLKIFIILDGIAMIISGGLIYILSYADMNSKTTYIGLPLKMGWDFVFEIIFLITSVLLVLALCIIIIHKFVHKVIRKIKKINNRA